MSDDMLFGYCGNYDGRNEAFVVAQNKKLAAATLKMSVYGFSQFFIRRTPWPVPSAKPGEIYLASMTQYPKTFKKKE